MKKLFNKFLFVLFAFIIVHCTFNIENCSAQWVQMSNGMGTNKFVQSFTSKDSNIFAGTNTGVYVSTNNGNSWTQTILNNQNVLGIAVSGLNIIVGTTYNGCYLSTNNGSNWIQTNMNNQYVFCLVANGNNVFAGTQDYPPNTGGVYFSTNYGVNWTQTSLNNQNVYSFAVSGSNIYAGFKGIGNYSDGGVFFSTNNGTIWTQICHFNQNPVFSLAVIGNNIFAGTQSYGVRLSTNNGTNWIGVNNGLTSLNIRSLVVSGTNLFAGTFSGGVFLSSNNGTNWIQINEGFNSTPSIIALLIANNYIFAGTVGQSIWKRPLSDFVEIKNISTEVPTVFSLSQNYPNPFNSTTKIIYQVKVESFVSLKIFNMTGMEVAILVNEKQFPSTYSVDWNASQYPSGVYFYRLEADNFKDTKKMMLIK